MIKYGLYSDCTLVNDNYYYFFVDVNYLGEPFVVAHVFIDLEEGTTEVNWDFVSSLRVYGFSEKELIDQIVEYCHNEMKKA